MAPPLQYSCLENPGELQFMGSLRVGHDGATSLSLFTVIHWRRKWQPTPVFLPGESQGQGSLVGCRLWCHTESDTTEATQQQQQHIPSWSPQYTDFIQKGTEACLSYSHYWQNLNLVHGSPFLASFVAHYITCKEVDFLFCGVSFNDL